MLASNYEGQQPWGFMGDNIGYFEIDESIDIHDETDLTLAKCWIEKNMTPPPQFPTNRGDVNTRVLIFSYHKLRNSYTVQLKRDTIRNTTVINTMGSFSERRWSA